MEEDPGNYFKQNGEPVIPLDGGKSQRIAILVYFVQSLGSPEESDGGWEGKDGAIAQIRKTLSIPRGTDIRSILRTIKQHEMQGTAYTGDRVGDSGGRPPHITLDSIYAQIIADCLEDGMSLRMTTNMVNEFCRVQNYPSFTMGPIQTVFRQLKPKVCRIKKRPQGSTDKNAPWSKARLNWVTQLLIRFGKRPSQVDPITGLIPLPWCQRCLPEKRANRWRRHEGS
jgi:hypothetical protein